jgi:TRAP-type C4-dicarboxylate transport system substrate-binding protein
MKGLLLVLCLAMSLSTNTRAQEVTHLLYASPYSSGHPFSRADQDWIDFVEAEGQGRIKVRAIWSGALLSSDQSMAELRHGVADIGLITPIYAKGGAHLLRHQTGFYSGIKTVENQLALYRCMADHSDQFARELEGLKVLAVQGGNLPGILTRNTAVNSLEDLRGLRIRAPTELLPLLKQLGADPVSMPMGEVYSALAKGVLDGVVAPTDTFKSLHFTEVTEHFFTLEIPRGAYPARAMGMRRWNSLGKDIQDILERGIPVWEAALARQTSTAQQTGLLYGEEQGMQFSVISPQDQQRFDEIYLHDAQQNAMSLDEFGIDGEAVFRLARASITADGGVNCAGSN